MKRKTTVTLTLTALLGLAGILYAANHSFFSAVQDPTFAAGPVGVAAAPADLIVSEYCTNTTLTNIDKVDCQGGFATIAQLHTFSGGGCQELYMTIAPNSAANAIPAPFSPRDYFVTSGPNIWQLRLPNPPTLFTMIPDGGCTSPGDHTGITFDHEGTFNFNLLVTCKGSGGVRDHRRRHARHGLAGRSDAWDHLTAGFLERLAPTGSALPASDRRLERRQRSGLRRFHHHPGARRGFPARRGGKERQLGAEYLRLDGPRAPGQKERHRVRRGRAHSPLAGERGFYRGQRGRRHGARHRSEEHTSELQS